MAQLEALVAAKKIDIYHGMLEGAQDIMGLKKAPTTQVDCGRDTVT